MEHTITAVGGRLLVYTLTGAIFYKVFLSPIFTAIEPYGWNTAIYVGMGYAFAIFTIDRLGEIRHYQRK